MSAPLPEVKRVWSDRETWPEVRITLLPLPWTWRLLPRFYADDLHPWGHASFDWLFWRTEWWAQDKPRDWFRENEHSDDSEVRQ